MKKAAYLTMIFTLLASLYVNGQTLNDNKDVNSVNGQILELTINECISLAYMNNLGLKVDNLDQLSKKISLISLYSLFLPNLNLRFTGTIVNKAILDDAKQQIIEGYKEYGINLSESEVYKTDEWKNIKKGYLTTELNMSYTFTAKTIFEINQAVFEFQEGKILLELAKNKIKKNVIENYFEILLLLEKINISKKNLSYAETIYNLENEKFKNQIITRLDKLSAEFNYEDKKIKLLENENEYNNLLLNLKRILGLNDSVKINLISKLEVYNKISINNLKSNNLINNLEIKLNNLSIIIEKNYTNLNIAALTPSVTLSFLIDPSYKKNDPFGNDIYWFDDINNDWKQKSGNFTFYINIPLAPLSPISSIQKNIINSGIEIKKKKITMEITKRDIEFEYIKLIQNFERYNNIIDSLTLRLSIAEEKYNLIKRFFESGSKSLLDLIESEDDYNESNLSLIKTKFDLIKTINELEYLLNIDVFNFSDKKK